MNQPSSVPEPIVVSLPSVAASTAPLRAIEQNEPIELRSLRVEEFLQARSLAPNTQKAYRQDLQQFLNWTNKGWAEVTPRHIAQFKAHLLRQDLESGQRVLSRLCIANEKFWSIRTNCPTYDDWSGCN